MIADAAYKPSRYEVLNRIPPLVLVVGLTSGALLFLWPILFLALDRSHHVYWPYNAGANALTYFNTGFSRRELAGTLTHLISADPMIGAAYLHLSTYAALTASFVFLIARHPSMPVRRLMLGLALLAVLLRLSLDVGRTDGLVMLLGLLAAHTAARGAWIVTALVLSIALAVHETGFLVLAPLTVAIAIGHGTWRRLTGHVLGSVVAIFLLTGILYVVGLQPHDDIGKIARDIHTQVANTAGPSQAYYADMAVYFTLSGARGLRTAVCEIWTDPNTPIQWLGAVVIPTMFTVGLCGWRRWPFLAMTLTWVAGLSLIGVDVGRWVTFAVFSILTFALLESDVRPIDINRRGILLVFGAFLLMSAGFTIQRGEFTPIPLADAVAQRVTNSLSPVDALAKCDPGWRAYLGLKAGPAPAAVRAHDSGF